LLLRTIGRSWWVKTAVENLLPSMPFAPCLSHHDCLIITTHLASRSAATEHAGLTLEAPGRPAARKIPPLHVSSISERKVNRVFCWRSLPMNVPGLTSHWHKSCGK